MFCGIYNEALAILLLRTVTGILFFFQGYDKIFNVKIINVVRTFNEPLNKLQIPEKILKPMISVSSFIELVCGFLLFIGLFSDISLAILSLNLIMVAFSFSFIKPMWDMKFYFPRMIFVVLLLLFRLDNDLLSLDYLLFSNCR